MEHQNPIVFGGEAGHLHVEEFSQMVPMPLLV